MVSAYAPNVSPPDFHALVEVYLDGSWHLVDPTGMTNADEVAIIGVGRDAADISFLTSFGFLELVKQTVSVKLLDESKP
jgi:transglutaminase-like putative cysteine protease